LAGLDAAWLTLALLLFLPQTLLSAWRWRGLAAPLCRVSLREAVRQTLAASAWNLAAPAKLGDLTKAAMLPLAAGERRRAWPLVILEKAADVAALALIWLAAGAWQAGGGWLIAASACLSTTFIVLFGRAAGHPVLSTQYPAPRIQYPVLSTQYPVLSSQLMLRTAAASLLLWLLHLAQIHLMLLSAGVPVGFDMSLARVPAAIFAGLLPVSLCGIGTRDGALIWLFSDVAPASTMAAVGLLTAIRYLVPGAAGIACLWRRSQLAPRADSGARRRSMVTSA
jgi:uncharacterized membrane protein YbhN (UPF0104 family)